MFRRALASRSTDQYHSVVADGDTPRQLRRRRPRKVLGIGGRKELILYGSLLLLVLFLVSLCWLINSRVIGNHLLTEQFEEIHLAPLSQIDLEKYTIRINTWKRLETLQISLDHHLTCPNVAQIQIIWCTAQGPPPEWLLSMEDVVVELHEENTLNERFRVLRPAPTKGILSLDDDILRPCIAYDWAFAKWTQHPSRIVGFDARSHEIASDGRWKYAYMSTTEKTNKYSLTLTRCCFVHVDYLNWYIANPVFASIRNMVADYKNCEDIALSLLVSSQTDGKPPLLAELWAVKSMIKLDNNQGKISAGKDHKSLRDNCVDTFAQQLGLKNKLTLTKLRHSSLFEYGDQVHWEAATHWNNTSQRIKQWKEDAKLLKSELMDLRAETAVAAYEAGLVEGSDPWRRRFHGLNSSIS